MSQPPSESGNVVDPEVLASRRARRAEVGEDASLELRLFEADRRLGEIAAERDTLRVQIEGLERDLRGTRQREWSEQQQRLEAQGEAAAARELAGSQLAELRERLTVAEAELATVAAERERARTALEDERQRAAAERERARTALEDERLRVTAERERREALEREGILLRAELVRREELTEAAADAVAEARRELAAGRASFADNAALEQRLAVERRDFAVRVAAVERAVAAVRERLGAAARVLRERLEAERDARLAAEAALGAERTARLAADAAVEAAKARAIAAEGRTADLATERDGAVARERGAVARERDAVARERDEAARTIAQEREAARAAVQERDGAIHAVRQERARVGELEQALAARVEVEAQLRTALDDVNGELAAVRAGDGDRAAKLAARVESVVALASGLREGVRRELGAEQDALTASLAAMQERVAELQAGVEEATALREELETERAARWVAESELDAERRRGDEDRAARAFAEQRLTEVEAELEALRAQTHRVGPDPTALASLRAALEHLQSPTAAERDTPSPSLSLDLTAAAERLRATVAATEEDDADADVEPDSASRDEAIEVVEPPAPAPELDAFAPTSAAPEPPAPPASETEPVAWEAPPAPVVLTGRQPLTAREPITTPGPWLRNALQGLAVDEPDIAELLVISLLSAQAGLVNDTLTYELAVRGGTTHRVVVEPDRVRVELPGQDPADARIAGPLAALVPLVAGGTGSLGRRLPGTQIEGRRQLRRLLKARRAPLGLAELAAADIAPSPGLLLTVLARAVDPRWATRPLTVDVASEGSDRWRVVASGNGPLTIIAAGDGTDSPTTGAPPASAVLHTSAHRLAAVLAGTAAPSDASVEGDARDVRTLLSWLDRAQRHQP